jgi:ATP-binding cassette subfamily B protein
MESTWHRTVRLRRLASLACCVVRSAYHALRPTYDAMRNTHSAPHFRRPRRVRVMRQLSEVECGPACLAMLLTAHGRHTRVPELRELLGTGRDGVTARMLVTAARAYGFDVKAFRCPPSALAEMLLPAIVHWRKGHFLVIERWSPRGVEVVDPADGRRRLSPEEFAEGFSGVVLVLRPGPEFERRRVSLPPAWRHLVRQFRRLPGTRRLLLQVLAASLLLQVLGLAVPVFTQVLVDRILPMGVTSVMTMLGLGMLALALSQAVTSYLRAALLIRLQARVDAQLMLGFFSHLLTLPFRFFQHRNTGDLLMRLSSNAMIREVLTSQSLAVVLDGVFVLVYLAILLKLSPLFGLLAATIGLFQVLLLLGTTRRVQELTARDLATQAMAQDYLVEALRGIGTLKASGAEHRAVDYWSELYFRHLKVSLSRNQLSAAIETALGTLRTLSPILLLWLGAARVLDGTMTLGTMLALNALAVSFLTPLGSLVANGQQFQFIGAHLDRLADVFETEPEQHRDEVAEAGRLTGRIEFRNVSFRYDPQGPMVLQNLTFAVEPGQKVALVGRTGSGKSTLAMLLLGLYAPTEGVILYDGVPLSRLSLPSVRGQFGVVMQEAFLFSGSIRENIAFNDPRMPLDRVVRAAQLAGIHEEIVQWPLGYETRLSEGGSGLSGGQRQRLSIARALAHSPALLLLDEATSHLDVVTEAQVDASLSGLDCTRVVIAHRLSTIRNADRILVLEEGELVESGTHDALLAREGVYASLVRVQQATDALAPGPPPASEGPSLGPIALGSRQ